MSYRIEWNEVHVKFPVLMNEVKMRVKQGRRGKSTPNDYASLRNLAPLHWNFIEDMPSRPFPEGKCLELTHSVPRVITHIIFRSTGCSHGLVLF